MKVVKFGDGTYGIRKLVFEYLSFRYTYRDLTDENHNWWWETSNKDFKDCKGDYRTVIGFFEKMKEDMKAVKIEKIREEEIRKEEIRNNRGRGLRKKEYRKLKVLHKIKGNMGIKK